MKLRSKIIIITALILIFSTGVFAQKRSTANWFGYVRTAYQYNLLDEGDNTGQFKLIVTTLGLVADINDYSSLYIFSFFDYPGVFNPEIPSSARKYAGILDAQVWFKPVKGLRLVMGQFVMPFATENLQSASKVDFINWGYVISNSPAYRDIGAYADYKHELFRLYMGVSNGSGMNVVDNNNNKRIIARGELTPSDGLKIAGGTSIGKDDQIDSLAESQSFYSANLSYKTSGLFVTAEGSYQEYRDDRTTAFYAYALYDIAIGGKLLHFITPAFRYDFLDIPGDDNRKDRYTMGLGFSFAEDKWLSLFRLNYELITSQTDTDPADNITLEFQMRFD